jgi:CDGSH-type Zn-finger protein
MQVGAQRRLRSTTFLAMSEIRIEQDGPYQVSGDAALARGRIVETEFGEPVAWEVGPDIMHGESYRLCRCGRSETKPFCDDSHLEGFDGTEVASREPTDTRRKRFEGGGVVLTDDISLCSHAGFCRDRFTSVWEMTDEAADPAIRERLEHMVSLCPSGRLAYEDPPNAEAVEPAFEPSIVVEENGPYWVRGGVPVTAADGRTWEVRNRITLCRCGHSQNKPFCDGSHKDVGFSG